MTNEVHIVRYTGAELDEMIRRGEDRTDWERLRNMTDEEVEANIDYEDEGHFDFSKAYVGPPSLPEMSDPANWRSIIPVDADIVEWFASRGIDYRQRINALLREHIAEQERQAS